MEISKIENRGPKSEKAYNVCDQNDKNCSETIIEIKIDDKTVKVKRGDTILDAAKTIGIKIPTLCYHEDLCIAGNCRMCLVAVEGLKTLQASCAYQIHEPITVKTHTKEVRQARQHVLELLLSNHYGECYSCVRNGNCELQTLASEYGIDHYQFGHVEESMFEIDNSSFSIIRDMNKCIQCRRCIRTCVDLQEVGVYESIGKGYNTHVSTFLDMPMSEVICINCGQCINRCPTGALHENDPRAEVWNAIDDPTKHVVMQTAPAPRSAIGETFGLEPGISLTLEMNTALRFAGFDKIFDTNFSADLTIMEEGTELLERLHGALVKKDKTISLPQFTSCSPGWIKYIEHFNPNMLDNLSSAKSPQQMFGTIIKTYYAEHHNINPADIVTVALMPCTAKKFECNRPEMVDSGFKDVDYGLTTRELAQMLKEAGIDLPNLEKSDFDNPFGEATGSGIIFGATGGVMESAIRTVYEIVSGEKIESLFDKARVEPVRGFEGIKYAELPINKIGPVPEILKNKFTDFEWLKGVTLKVAVCHGTANAKRILENIQEGGKFSECHFIEFMACPGGCLGGGGMPIPTNEKIRAARANAIYAEDEASTVRKSYENPNVLKLYNEFLPEGPCSPKSHHLLHTNYIERGKKMV